jgi:hypothetical protein
LSPQVAHGIVRRRHRARPSPAVPATLTVPVSLSHPPARTAPRARTGQLHSIASRASCALLFAVAYTQAPLYSSNQNEKFLHGLARAGVGFLQDDWLANTADPFPAFTLLVSLTYQHLHEYAFYLYYAAILALYLYALVGIVSALPAFSFSAAQCFNYVAVLTALHSDLLSRLSQRLLGFDLPKYLQYGVAGQYVLGPGFQPSVFGVFLLLSIYAFLRGHPFRAIACLGIAVTFHPNYTLSAATLTLAYMLLTVVRGRDVKRAFALGAISFILVLPTLVYVGVVLAPQSAETLREFLDVSVNIRDPHHAIPDRWVDRGTVAQLLVVIAAVFLIRRTALFPVLLLSTAVAAGLTIVRVFTDSTSLASLFPWRLSVFIVPLSTAIVLAALVKATSPRVPALAQGRRIGIALGWAALLLLALRGALDMQRDFAAAANVLSMPAMNFARDNRARGQVFLVPPGPSSSDFDRFRLYTGLPIVVDWKSTPGRDVEYLEWYRRFREAERFHDSGGADCALLEEMRAAYGVTHVILDTARADGRCSRMEEIYRDASFGVYRLV